MRARDYRDVDSILAIRTLRHTRWGLVVKIDAEEALAPTVEIRDILSIAFGVTIVFVLAGWALYLHPAGASAQARLASGRARGGGRLRLPARRPERRRDRRDGRLHRSPGRRP